MIKLVLTKEKKIEDVQQAFNAAYPFLKLEFQRSAEAGHILTRRNLPPATPLELAGLSNPGEIILREDMAVYELEQAFKNLFGLNIQLSRKAGVMWLETTKTDKWSLQKQNEHGREISIPEKEEIIDRDLTDTQ